MDNLHEIPTTADFNTDLFDMLSAEEGDFLEPYTDTANPPIPTDGIGLILTDDEHLIYLEKLLGLVPFTVGQVATYPSWLYTVPGVTIAGADGTFTYDTSLIQEIANQENSYITQISNDINNKVWPSDNKASVASVGWVSEA